MALANCSRSNTPGDQARPYREAVGAASVRPCRPAPVKSVDSIGNLVFDDESGLTTITPRYGSLIGSVPPTLGTIIIAVALLSFDNGVTAVSALNTRRYGVMPADSGKSHCRGDNSVLPVSSVPLRGFAEHVRTRGGLNDDDQYAPNSSPVWS